MTIGGRSHFGLSVHNDQMAAQVISAVEAYERAFMHSRGIVNSSGCAVHTDRNTCITNAQNELMERDAYLRFHFLGNTFNKLTPPSDSLMSTCQKELQKLGIKLHFGSIGENIHGNACIAIADGRNKTKNPFGLMIGLGFESTLQASLEKSFYEIIRFIDGSYSDNFPIEPMSFEQFYKLDKPGVHEHIGLGMDMEYADFLLLNYMKTNEPKQGIPHSPKLKDITVKANIEGLSNCPLYFSQAISDDLIGIEFGNDPAHNFLAQKLEHDELLHYKNKIAFHVLG